MKPEIGTKIIIKDLKDPKYFSLKDRSYTNPFKSGDILTICYNFDNKEEFLVSEVLIKPSQITTYQYDVLYLKIYEEEQINYEYEFYDEYLEKKEKVEEYYDKYPITDLDKDSLLRKFLER